MPPVAGRHPKGPQEMTAAAKAGKGGQHVPVLLDEAIKAIDPQPGDVIVDATFGAGGYSRVLLDLGATVHAFDRDPDAIAKGRKWPETAAGESGEAPLLVLHQRRFSEMVASLNEAGVTRVDGIVMDIGVSSMQLDQSGRGFSFMADGPLDMRMSQDGPSAADFLNTAREEEIADVLYRFGDERGSRRVARAIVRARPLETTAQLANVVRKALRHKPDAPKDPATRTFQAVRIQVNAELEELEAGLRAAESLLRVGGRLAVVSFHSLEDRIVKSFMREGVGAHAGTSRHLPQKKAPPPPVFSRALKPVRPTEAEKKRNPRARSATLRAVVRTAAPARQAV